MIKTFFIGFKVCPVANLGKGILNIYAVSSIIYVMQDY